MKSITIKTLATGIVASVLLFTSCAGPAGATGPQGVAGTNGSTNVASYPFSTQNSSWVVNTNNYEQDATFSIPAITADVVTNGTIQVFLGNSAGTSWSAMPFSITSKNIIIRILPDKLLFR